MTKIQTLFLEAYQASIQNRTVSWTEVMADEEWLALFELANTHKALPLVYEAVYASEVAKQASKGLMQYTKQRMIGQVMLQTQKTAEFKKIYAALEAQGIEPIVMKGIVLRALYPNPDFRPSGDEDILIDSSQFMDAHRVMLANGYQTEVTVYGTEHQVAYYKMNTMVSIELHQTLLNDKSDIYREMNQYFAHAKENSITCRIEGANIRTLGVTDHLLFLIFHALKHFINRGVGIRQIADICLYANAYGSEVDWDWIYRCTKEMRGDLFLQAMFQIGVKYLTLDPIKACLPSQWNQQDVDEIPMLEDCLSGGVYGKADDDRVQGGAMVSTTVEANRAGSRMQSGLIRRLFPSAEALRNRFPYLGKHPQLLPIAWISRVWIYGKEIRQGKQKPMKNSLEYSNKKIDVLKQYGIIEK